jgi:myosin heavy chain 6/7
LDASQRDARNLATDLFKAKTVQDELAEALEGTRRENKALAQEIKDLTDQLGEGGRSVHELQKVRRQRGINWFNPFLGNIGLILFEEYWFKSLW